MTKRVRYRPTTTRPGVVRDQHEITQRRDAYLAWPHRPVGADPDALGARASALLTGFSVASLQDFTPELRQLTCRGVAAEADFNISVLDMLTTYIERALKSARDHRSSFAQTNHERIDELLWLGGYDDVTYCPPGYWALPRFGVPKLMDLCGRLGLIHVFNDVARSDTELTEMLKLASSKPCSIRCDECIFHGS